MKEKHLFSWELLLFWSRIEIFLGYLEHFCGSRIKAEKNVSWNLERHSDSSYIQQRVLNDDSIWYQLLAAFLRWLPPPKLREFIQTHLLLCLLFTKAVFQFLVGRFLFVCFFKLNITLVFELTHTCFIPDHRHRSEWVCEDWLGLSCTR